jgi:hypothetical protein
MSDWTTPAALWTLVLVFTWSGATKLTDVRGTALALVDLRVTRRLQPAAAAALGGAELLLAGALAIAALGAIPVGAPACAAVAALAAFTVVLARALHRDERVACHCFGSSEEPIGASDLIRNAALILVVLAALAGPASVTETSLPAAPILAVAAVLGGALVAATIKLLNVNSDPLGERADRWEQRLRGDV